MRIQNESSWMCGTEIRCQRSWMNLLMQLISKQLCPMRNNKWNLQLVSIHRPSKTKKTLFWTVSDCNQIWKQTCKNCSLPSSLQWSQWKQLAAYDRKSSGIFSFQGLFHGQPISQVTWQQQMEDMEDSDWQSRGTVTNKLFPLYWLLISAERSLPDMAAVRVNQSTELELAGY